MFALALFLGIRIYKYQLWTSPTEFFQWVASGGLLGAAISNLYQRPILGAIIGVVVVLALVIAILIVAISSIKIG
jgi:hypothetical protein